MYRLCFHVFTDVCQEYGQMRGCFMPKSLSVQGHWPHFCFSLWIGNENWLFSILQTNHILCSFPFVTPGSEILA